MRDLEQVFHLVLKVTFEIDQVHADGLIDGDCFIGQRTPLAVQGQVKSQLVVTLVCQAGNWNQFSIIVNLRNQMIHTSEGSHFQSKSSYCCNNLVRPHSV